MADQIEQLLFCFFSDEIKNRRINMVDVRDFLSVDNRKLQPKEMFRMKAFPILCVAFCCAALAAADINDAKKAGIKKLEALVAEIRNLADKTSVEVDDRSRNIDIISKHYIEFASGIMSSSNVQIANAAKSAYMLATLLGSSNDIFRCIERNERDGSEDCINNYRSKFAAPEADYFLKASKYQRDLIKVWKDDYYAAIDKYGEIYRKAGAEIQKATKEEQIDTTVKEFERTTTQMANIIVSIHPDMAKTHIQVLTTDDSYLTSFQQYARYRVEDTTKAIQKCFPRFLRQQSLSKSFLSRKLRLNPLDRDLTTA